MYLSELCQTSPQVSENVARARLLMQQVCYEKKRQQAVLPGEDSHRGKCIIIEDTLGRGEADWRAIGTWDFAAAPFVLTSQRTTFEDYLYMWRSLDELLVAVTAYRVLHSMHPLPTKRIQSLVQRNIRKRLT